MVIYDTASFRYHKLSYSFSLSKMIFEQIKTKIIQDIVIIAIPIGK